MTQMKLVCLMASAALFAFASPTFAQSSDMVKDKAMDMAKDQAKDMVKKKVKGQTGDLGAKAIDVGANMMDGKSMKDVAIDAAMDKPKISLKDQALGSVIGGGMVNEAGSMSTDEKIKAGKILMKGGSVQDAGTAIAKDRAKDKLMDKAGEMLSKQMITETAPKTPAMPAALVNCPSGTTAQPDGTCMITGDYEPS